jgi:NRPS condensation-like uncharacterized protein
MRQKTLKWKKLDNASKIFPATCNNRDTKVFRLACELYDDVDPDILQKAVELAIDSFPLYKSVLRRGAFWYYFEMSELKPIVQVESKPVCAPIYIKGLKNLLFRVFYYKKRINLEVFHALTDGAGCIWFMESIIYYYMTLKYEELSKDIPKINYRASISEKMDDSFERNFHKDIAYRRTFKNEYKKAYRIKGTRNQENRMKLIEGTMSAKKVLELSHKHNTTLTVFLTSLFLYSIYKDMPSDKINQPIVLSVPINLRQYYESYTARNFFSTMNISYDFGKNSNSLEDIIKSVHESFKNGLTKEKLDLHLYRFMSLERNPITRIIPLPIKDFALKIANYINDMRITTSISNIGQIKMPSEFSEYINKFTICVSARRPQITLCSYKDNLVISFTSPFEETDIQRIFFQYLTNNGIDVQITSNL